MSICEITTSRPSSKKSFVTCVGSKVNPGMWNQKPIQVTLKSIVLSPAQASAPMYVALVSLLVSALINGPKNPIFPSLDFIAAAQPATSCPYSILPIMFAKFVSSGLYLSPVSNAVSPEAKTIGTSGCIAAASIIPSPMSSEVAKIIPAPWSIMSETTSGTVKSGESAGLTKSTTM